MHSKRIYQLKGHVPGLIKKSTLPGPTDPNTHIELLIGLHPRNETNLKSYVDNTFGTHSTTGHRYLIATQVAASSHHSLAAEQRLLTICNKLGSAEAPRVRITLHRFHRNDWETGECVFCTDKRLCAPRGREFYAPEPDPNVPILLARSLKVCGLMMLKSYASANCGRIRREADRQHYFQYERLSGCSIQYSAIMYPMGFATA